MQKMYASITWYAQAELTCSNAYANAEYPYAYGQNYRKITYILSMGKKVLKLHILTNST
jgi:hypothetical protein